MRILFTSVGGPLFPVLLKFLKKDKQLKITHVVGIDRRKISNIINLNKFYLVKDNNKYKYIKKIINICIEEKIKLIVPYSDTEAKIISQFKNKLSNLGIKSLVNNYSTIKKIENKCVTYNILKKKKIKVPIFKKIKNIIQLKKALIEFNYPEKGIVLKPINNAGGRGVIILNGKKFKSESLLLKGKRIQLINKEKKTFSKKLFKYGDLMMMEILKAPAYDVDNFNFKKDNLIVIRRRINPAGIPYKGNYIINNKKIEQYCRKISTTLKLKYLTDIDLLTGKNNEPLLLEVNPRPSGSSVVSYFAGIPLFSYCIAKVMNKKYILNKRLDKKFNKAIHI